MIALSLLATLSSAAPAPAEPVRGIYVNAWAFGTRKFYQLARLADSTALNAFVIDIKDDTGYLTYRSASPLALKIRANHELWAPYTAALVDLLRSKGIRP